MAKKSGKSGNGHGGENPTLRDVVDVLLEIKTDVNARLGDINARFGDINARFAKMEEAIIGTNSRIDATNVRLDGVLRLLGEHYREHDKRLEDLERRLSIVEGKPATQ